MEFVARTDVGCVRADNQDCVAAFVHAGYLVGIVADGMGGAAGGATASKMAIASLKESLLSALKTDADTDAVKEILRAAYSAANAKIYAAAQADAALQGMGTTLTVAVIKDGHLLVSNIGDSRAYLLRNTGIAQLTVDQTLVQQLVDSGVITPEAARIHPQRNVILEAVGTSETIAPEFFEAELCGERVLLCSDGLSGEVEDAQISEIVQASDSVAEAADALIAQANAAGGGDNISVVLLSVQQDSAKGCVDK